MRNNLIYLTHEREVGKETLQILQMKKKIKFSSRKRIKEGFKIAFHVKFEKPKSNQTKSNSWEQNNMYGNFYVILTFD